MYAKFQGQKIHRQKVNQNLSTLVVVETFYVMRKRVLRDEIQKLKDPYKE
jgi:hypothetical protein